MDFVIIVHSAEEGGYWCEVPSLPGCFAQGEALDDLINEAREAIISHREALRAEGWQWGSAQTLATRLIAAHREYRLHPHQRAHGYRAEGRWPDARPLRRLQFGALALFDHGVQLADLREELEQTALFIGPWWLLQSNGRAQLVLKRGSAPRTGSGTLHELRRSSVWGRSARASQRRRCGIGASVAPG